MGHVYVIRHGQSECNADGVIQGPRLDPGLSELGKRQARALGDAFDRTPLDAVVMSPMARARSTAQAVIDRQPDAVAQVAPEAYEIDYGDFCGQRLADVQEDLAQVFDAWSLGFVDQAFPGGESAALAQHRIKALALRLLDMGPDAHVAVIAHGRINRILLATMLGAPLSGQDRFPQANANITHLEVGESNVVRRLNDTQHLTGLAS